MNDIVVFTEEPSAKIIAQAIANKLDLSALCIEHQGKSDLESSFPRKIRVWGGKPRFIVVRDNDAFPNCVIKKASLTRLVPLGFADRVKIRLVMQELESWYIGDPQALRAAGLIDARRAQNWSKQKKYRNPDLIQHAKEDLRRAVGEHGQIEMARRIGPHLSLERNLSRSFCAFVAAMRWAAGA